MWKNRHVVRVSRNSHYFNSYGNRELQRPGLRENFRQTMHRTMVTGWEERGRTRYRICPMWTTCPLYRQCPTAWPEAISPRVLAHTRVFFLFVWRWRDQIYMMISAIELYFSEKIDTLYQIRYYIPIIYQTSWQRRQVYCNKFPNAFKRYCKLVEKIIFITSPSFSWRDREEAIRALDPIKVFSRDGK